MKPKKSKKANLEKFRTIFFQTGMILTLSAILIAFEWKSEYEYQSFDNGTGGTSTFEEIIPITRPEKEKIIKPPTPVERFTIEANDVEIEDEPFFIDIEDNGPDPFANINFDEDPEVITENPVLVAQFMPTFQGKEANYFRNYVASKVRFPTSAVENGVTGTVYISFVINKDGSVTNVEVLRGVHPIVDKAVVKVIGNSPKWEPGIQDGKFVRVKYSIAIAFELQ